MNSYILFCKNTCGMGEEFTLLTPWVFCRLVQEGDILCVPTSGCAECLEVNADKLVR